MKIKNFFAELLHSDSRRSKSFYRIISIFDGVAVWLFFVKPFFGSGTVFSTSVELFFGVLFLIEFLLRVWTSPDLKKLFCKPLVWTDIFVIVALFLPVLFSFSRIAQLVSVFSLLRIYRMIDHLTRSSKKLSLRKDVLIATANLFVFLAFTSELIFLLQQSVNEKITSYLDAFYYVTTTLATVGYGDITLVGVEGRLLAIGLMIFGVGLFAFLGKTILNKKNNNQICESHPDLSHATDADFCRRCGERLKKKG